VSVYGTTPALANMAVVVASIVFFLLCMIDYFMRASKPCAGGTWPCYSPAPQDLEEEIADETQEQVHAQA